MKDKVESSYEVVEFSEAPELQKLITDLQVANITFACINQSINEQGSDDDSLQQFSDEILKFSLERAFVKLAYRLKRALSQAGRKVTCDALANLLMALKQEYHDSYDGPEDFEEFVHADALLFNTFIEVSCFDNQQTGLVSEEYIDHLAAQAVLGDIPETTQSNLIEDYIGQSHDKLATVYADPVIQEYVPAKIINEAFSAATDGLKELYQIRLDLYRDPDILFEELIKEIAIVCDENDRWAKSKEELLSYAAEVRKIVPVKLSRFNPFIKKYLAEFMVSIQSSLKMINIEPTIDDVWDKLISIYFYFLESTNARDLESTPPPAMPTPTKKYGAN